MRRWLAMTAVTAGLVLTIPTVVSTQSDGVARRIDGRDALLAALGSATLECLETVGPFDYGTESGVLTRLFQGCRARNTDALARVARCANVGTRSRR